MRLAIARIPPTEVLEGANEARRAAPRPWVFLGGVPCLSGAPPEMPAVLPFASLSMRTAPVFRFRTIGETEHLGRHARKAGTAGSRVTVSGVKMQVLERGGKGSSSIALSFISNRKIHRSAYFLANLGFIFMALSLTILKVYQ